MTRPLRPLPTTPKRIELQLRRTGNLPEYRTRLGLAFLGDSLQLLRAIPTASVDLIMTSPPFGLVRKKPYGNEDAANYVQWFLPFGIEMKRVLRASGSLVLDIGGSWERGRPVRSLYHLELLLALCKEVGFNLAQEFFWWNPARLPTPAEWVTVRRVRVKDAVNCVFWLSKTPFPKASNRRVLQPYSDSMLKLLANGYKPGKRPSGHVISRSFDKRNPGAIPSNLLAIANTESQSQYQRYCRTNGLPVHPARYPLSLPAFFIRMLTDRQDWVLDPFFGSGVTGAAAEQLGRRWIGCELDGTYLKGSRGRFGGDMSLQDPPRRAYSLFTPDTSSFLPETPRALPRGSRRKSKSSISSPNRTRRK